MHTHTITNDDGAPTVAFNVTSSSETEATGNQNLAVDLSAASGQAVTVSYTVTGTATGSGVDYTLANGTATIAAGSTSTNIVLAIVEDALDETNETVIVTLSSPSNASLGTNTVHTLTITDDDEPFATVVIGTQTWSASNVSIVPTTFNSLGADYWNAYAGSNGSGDATNEDGYYYTWDAAQNVCPTGWSLPSDTDWKTLEGHLGMSTAQQNVTGWRGTDEGTKLKVGGSSGFEAKLAGLRNTDGSFYYRGDSAYLWSSTESGGKAYRRLLVTSGATVSRDALSKAVGFSVRCLKD